LDEVSLGKLSKAIGVQSGQPSHCFWDQSPGFRAFLAYKKDWVR
jgi:hypothetical protein